jgi:hypothetical protein
MQALPEEPQLEGQEQQSAAGRSRALLNMDDVEAYVKKARRYSNLEQS